MALTPPPLPDGYRWHIDKNNWVTVQRHIFGLGFRVLCVNHRAEPNDPVEAVHNRCLAVADIFANYRAIRAELDATDQLPEGWSVKVRPFEIALRGAGGRKYVYLTEQGVDDVLPYVVVTPETVIDACLAAIGKRERAVSPTEAYRQRANQAHA
jgi:hypothetical protein